MSDYSWISLLSLSFARYAKARDPKVLTLMGGPNFPLDVGDQETYLRSMPEIDVAVRGPTYEGEHAFLSLIQRYHDVTGSLEGLAEEAAPGNLWIDRRTGELAEVGVFRGGTARIMCEAKGNRVLHLFDTFEGLPAPSAIDTGFEEGQYACSLEAVQAYLAGYSGVHFYQGLFPATGQPIHDHRFSFVHLDVDLYESTLEALRFFYPRMNRGAMLVSHDYVEFPAVLRAFDEFFDGTAQPVLELSGNQCVVVKVTD